MTVNINASLTQGLVLTSDTSGVVAFQSNNAETMRIDTSGNVGIGTTSPSTKLQVSGSSGSLNARINAGNTGLDITNNDATGVVNLATSPLGAGGKVMSFTMFNGTSSAEAMRIDSSGNLLVGTTTLVAKLNVVASSLVSAGYNTYFRNTWSGDVGYPALYVAKYDNNTTTSQIFMRFSVNNETTASGQINANGANSAAFGSFSDERLKENIVDLPSQLGNICSLRPVEFDYKDGSGHQIGFVAQEMQEVYPDVVGVGADDMLTITGWSKTEARLVKAIQEQQSIISDLQYRIAALEAK